MTKDEMETIITFNQADDDADVYSCQPRVWARMRVLGIVPYDTKKNRRGRVITKSYTIPANYVFLRKPKRVNILQRHLSSTRLKDRHNRTVRVG